MDEFERINLYPSVPGLMPFGPRHGSFSGKGLGFFGPLALKSGGNGHSTEISSEIGLGLQAQEYPLMAPTLTRRELAMLLQGMEPTDDIYDKAERWAAMRRAQGMSPFIQQGELRIPAGLLDVFDK